MSGIEHNASVLLYEKAMGDNRGIIIALKIEARPFTKQELIPRGINTFAYKNYILLWKI